MSSLDRAGLQMCVFVLFLVHWGWYGPLVYVATYGAGYWVENKGQELGRRGLWKWGDND